MERIKMITTQKKSFAEGYEEFVLDMKARNLREGTIHHYDESIKQIYKRIPAETKIAELDRKTVPEFIIKLREDPKLNDVSMRTYARDLNSLIAQYKQEKIISAGDL